MKNFIILIMAGIIVYILTFWGLCGQSPAMGNEYNLAKAKMESMLFQLADSDNPQEFAERHGIEVKDGMVKVVIETNEDPQAAERLLNKFQIKIISQYHNLLKVYIHIDDLIPVSQERQVKYIRFPYKPQPLQSDRQ